MLGTPKNNWKKIIFISEWGNVSVLISCAVITSIMSAVCLKDTMWTLDTHTLWYGYIFLLFQGLNLLPPFYYYYYCLFYFSQNAHYCWVFVVSLALAGVTGAPKRYSEPLDMHFGKGELQISWLCTISFSATDFWTPASVYEIPNPPPSEV